MGGGLKAGSQGKGGAVSLSLPEGPCRTSALGGELVDNVIIPNVP